jgi:uncharacterized protein (DUF58 family)
MWTKKGGLILFLGTISLLLGLIIPDFQFVVLALITFTFFFLVLLVPKPSFLVEREVINNVMFENGDVKVKLDVKRSGFGYGTVEVYDRIPEYVELHNGLNLMIFNPMPVQPMEYHLKFPLRGYYSIGPTMVRTADHFNIFYNDQDVQEKVAISVFPHVSGMKDFRFKSKKNIHYPGEFLTLQAGTSTEFYHIRDYIKGDPFKKINWKVYARKRELMINEFEKENICDTLLFLDARSISSIGSITENSLEYGIKIALAVTNFLIYRRNQVGIVVYNDRVSVLPPKPGVKQLNEILSFLTGIYSKGWTDIHSAINYAKPYMKSKTTIIIISNLEYDKYFLSAMQFLSAHEYRVIIISPSSVDFEIKINEYSGPREKIELFKMGRENFINELNTLGIKVIQFLPEDSIDDTLEQISHEILR